MVPRRGKAMMGPSRSGKSTLLHCLAGLDKPDSGQVWIGGEEITAMPDRQLTRLRRDRAILGIVNTIALSVAERTRELGLLRAIGMRRGQLRLMIAGESLIVGGIGAALGTALGLGLGASLAAAFTRSQQLTVAIPAGQIVIYAFAAAFTGVLAAIGPAHRAARMNMLAAMTTE
jgi:energy-coupling factor transporter ATP-binding protein EcfA2